jgi:hypothetical protein
MADFPLNVIQAGVAIADQLTKGVQVEVQIVPYIGSDSKTGKVYGTPQTVSAIEDLTATMIYSRQGALAVAGMITVLQSITPNGATLNPSGTPITPLRMEPVDSRDLIITSQGSRRSILSTPGAISTPEGSPITVIGLASGA